jgi:NAD(P)-dependent dehydrogenase (short-subunit alcohol dehydrogenase family)
MYERWSLGSKRAVVTGGARGIGRAAADALLELGAQVLVAARDRDEIALAREAWRKSSYEGDGVTADITSAEGQEALARMVEERWGALDILVNNVGAGVRKPLLELSDGDVADMVARNFTSTLNVSRRLFPLLSLKRARCGQRRIDRWRRHGGGDAGVRGTEGGRSPAH